MGREWDCLAGASLLGIGFGFGLGSGSEQFLSEPELPSTTPNWLAYTKPCWHHMQKRYTPGINQIEKE